MSPVLADIGIVFGFVLVIVLAMVVAVVGVFGLVFKVLGAVVRTVFGIGRREGGVTDARVASAIGRQVCGDPTCGEENFAEAVYCRQCGRRLDGRL